MKNSGIRVLKCLLKCECLLNSDQTKSIICSEVKVAPHHDCFIHAPLVASSPAGLIVEAFTDPERDPLQAELFENPPEIKNGRMKLNEEPGLGLTLSEEAVKKFGEKIQLELT